MIHKWVRDILNLYSFVEKIESKDHYLFIYYKKEDIVKYKKISLRANQKQIISCVEKIKEEIGYKEIKLKRDMELRKSMGAKVPIINIKG